MVVPKATESCKKIIFKKVMEALTFSFGLCIFVLSRWITTSTRIEQEKTKKDDLRW
jgi:hypothetical protein